MRAGEHAHWPSQRTGSGMPSGVSTGDLPCASYLGPSAPSETEPHPIQSSRMPTFFFFKYQRNDYKLSQILGAKRAARHLHEGLGGSGTVFGQLWLSF